MVRPKKISSTLDEKDMTIVNMLMKNARATLREIADVLGMTDVAVRKRLQRLERDRIIQGYTAVVDPRALGFSVISLTGVDVEPGDLLRVARELATREYVKSAWITAGDHEIMLEIWARNEAEMDEIIREISAMQGVKRVCPAVVTERLKSRC
mgnify:FL=1